MFFFSDVINWHLVDQWHATIIIIDLIILVMRVLCSLGRSSMDDRPFDIIFGLVCGFVLLVLCKDYLKEYVDLSKI